MILPLLYNLKNSEKGDEGTKIFVKEKTYFWITRIKSFIISFIRFLTKEFPSALMNGLIVPRTSFIWICSFINFGCYFRASNISCIISAVGLVSETGHGGKLVQRVVTRNYPEHDIKGGHHATSMLCNRNHLSLFLSLTSPH